VTPREDRRNWIEKQHGGAAGEGGRPTRLTADEPRATALIERPDEDGFER
jgi:hypothetical protein